MAINKVVYGSQTLIDLTTDTVASADDILLGKVGHLRDGTVVTGTASGGDPHGTIWQDGQGNVHLDDESGIALQSKTATPSESQQVIEADEGYYALDKVTVGAISSSYVGSGVARRSSSDLTASGATVTVPAGYYASQASKAVASGTAGTPTATKGTVSNHAVTVTPSVTNTTGYITGETKTGTGVSVSASELVSGTYSVTSSGTKDVTDYASISVPAGTEGTPTATKGSVSNHAVTVTPSVTNTSGYIAGSTKTGTAVTVSASELVSGSFTIASSGYKDVTNYEQVYVGAGTEGTPTATKGTVSNNSVTVTPSVTNTGGYISGSTKTGTAVTVSASELVSGTKSITENGTGIDVMNYASVDVNVVTQYTATISRNDDQTVPYANVNSTGTRYKDNGQTFTWTDGDTIDFYLGASGYFGFVYVNGVEVYSSRTGGHYVYTPPSKDISIEFQRNTSSETSYVYITYPGKMFTATITGSGEEWSLYVVHNNVKYYQVGTFTFAGGDQLIATCGNSSGNASIIYNDDTYSSETASSYFNKEFTLPYSDISIDVTLQNNQIVIQTAMLHITTNGVYSVSDYDRVDVSVSGSSSSSYELIASTTYVVNTSSTTAVSVGTFNTGDTRIWTSDKMLYVKIRDTAGRRNGYYYGSDCMFANSVPGNNLTATSNYLVHGTSYYQNSAGYLVNFTLQRTSETSATQGYGVYATHVHNDGSIDIYARYNSSNTLTINGTFKVDVYLLDWPGGISPFNG